MICGYDLERLFVVASDLHPGRAPFTIESELQAEYPMFCHMIDISRFLAEHGYMLGAHAEAVGAEHGNRLSLSDVTEMHVPIRIPDHPALVGVDSENYPEKMHWVFWDGKNILDPNPATPDARPLSDFDGTIYDWLPLVKIEPFDESNKW